ncbi:MAG TPA: UvrB/UvrC motif-containing protein [Candidatus Glassbacteria bacterium]|nr:UvrB/UvrC motif-containing protein [Candidatus Glassbacteria bacterium]
MGAALVCPECGETFAEFQKRGLFGCAACYRMFAPELDRLLKRIHGACRHKADAPDGEKIGRESLFFLERQLKQAVARDAFEEAARLRDQIALRKAQVREP